MHALLKFAHEGLPNNVVHSSSILFFWEGITRYSFRTNAMLHESRPKNVNIILHALWNFHYLLMPVFKVLAIYRNGRPSCSHVNVWVI